MVAPLSCKNLDSSEGVEVNLVPDQEWVVRGMSNGNPKMVVLTEIFVVPAHEKVV